MMLLLIKLNQMQIRMVPANLILVLLKFRVAQLSISFIQMETATLLDIHYYQKFPLHAILELAGPMVEEYGLAQESTNMVFLN